MGFSPANRRKQNLENLLFALGVGSFFLNVIYLLFFL